MKIDKKNLLFLLVLKLYIIKDEFIIMMKGNWNFREEIYS